MMFFSDTAALDLLFLDSSLHISGGLQGAGKGTVLWEVIKILLHLQKLSSFSPFPSTALQPKVTPPQVLPGMHKSLVWGSISLKIMFVYLILSCPQSHHFLSSFFQLSSHVKSRKKPWLVSHAHWNQENFLFFFFPPLFPLWCLL